VKGEPKPGRHKYGFFNYSYFEYLLIMRAPRHHSLPPPPKKQHIKNAKTSTHQATRERESSTHQQPGAQSTSTTHYNTQKY